MKELNKRRSLKAMFGISAGGISMSSILSSCGFGDNASDGNIPVGGFPSEKALTPGVRPRLIEAEVKRGFAWYNNGVGAVPWAVNATGDWYDSLGVLNGTSHSATMVLLDTDQERAITLPINAIAGNWYADQGRSTILHVQISTGPSGYIFADRSDASVLHRPRVVYNYTDSTTSGPLEATADVGIGTGGFAGQAVGAITVSSNQIQTGIFEFPPPTKSVASATLTLWITFDASGVNTLAVNQLAYPGESPPGQSAAINSRVTIRNSSLNAPIAFVMSFAKGEIVGEPVARVGNAAIATQSLVTRRWDDQSVRLAKIYLVAPTAASTFDIDWASRAVTPEVTTPITDILNPSLYNFDSKIVINSVSRSVRDLLTTNSFTKITSGSVVTELRVADPIGSMDLGPGTALRPGWILRVWHNPTKRVWVREYAGTEVFDKLGDITYSIELKRGSIPAPSTVESIASLTHYFGKRWSRSGWALAGPGVDPVPQLPVSYLAKVGTIPFYDPSKAMIPTQITDAINQFNNRDNSLLGSGLWETYMGGGAGRPDIAPDPGWHKNALINAQPDLRTIAIRMSEMAGGWAMHFREPGTSTRAYGYAGPAGSAAGRPVNAVGRLRLQFAKGNSNLMNDNQTAPADQPTFFNGVPPYLGSPQPDLVHPKKKPPDPLTTAWYPDGSHMPNPFRISYLMTADPYWVEQMEFWASWSSLHNDPAILYVGGRGPAGTGWAVQDLRGLAWMLRARAVFAYFAQQGSPEEVFYSKQLDNCLAVLAGAWNLTGTPWNGGNECYNWGVNYARKELFRDVNGGTGYFGLPPESLGIPTAGSISDKEAAMTIDKNEIITSHTSYQVHFMTIVTEEILAMGFRSEWHLEYLSRWPIALFASGCKYTIADYDVPRTKTATGGWYTTISDLFATSRNNLFPNWYSDTESPYLSIDGDNPPTSRKAFEYWAMFNSEESKRHNAYPASASAALAALQPRYIPQYWDWIRPLVHETNTFIYGGFGILPRPPQA
jgi:hypothetical protein